MGVSLWGALGSLRPSAWLELQPAIETAVPQASSSRSLVVVYFTTIPEAAPKMTWAQVRQELTEPHFIEETEKAQVTNSVLLSTPEQEQSSQTHSCHLLFCFLSKVSSAPPPLYLNLTF